MTMGVNTFKTMGKLELRNTKGIAIHAEYVTIKQALCIISRLETLQFSISISAVATIVVFVIV